MIHSPLSSMLQALESGQVTAASLLAQHLAEINRRDGRIGAFLSLNTEQATQSAAEIDRKRAAGEPLGPLAGIPVALKDNMHILGQKTTCASRILENFVAPFHATVVERLIQADAILIGKTNMDEFAMGSSTEFSALQVTRNPVNEDHVPGGSSGGSAAAVAAHMTPLALGSSTGGSIRQPAAFCGVVGMKPSYGRVSRYGLVAYGSSLDQIGPLARDVEGAARLLQVVAGHDPRDATSVTTPMPDLLARLEQDPKSLRVGVIREFDSAGALQSEVQEAEAALLDKLRAAGAEIVTCSFPHTEYAIPAYYLVATAEASANLSRFDGIRYGHRTDQPKTLRELYIKSRGEGFGPEVKRRILLGTYCLSSGYYEGYYRNAQKVRTKIIEDFQQAFQSVDVILSPTTPSTAFRFGEKTADPVAMYLEDIYTVTANLAGVPAISIPVGKDKQGLPIGCQLLAPHYREDSLLQIARYCEKLLGSN